MIFTTVNVVFIHFPCTLTVPFPGTSTGISLMSWDVSIEKSRVKVGPLTMISHSEEGPRDRIVPGFFTHIL